MRSTLLAAAAFVRRGLALGFSLAGACTPLEPGSDMLFADGGASRSAVLAGARPPEWSCLSSLEPTGDLIRPASEGRRWVHSVRALSLTRERSIPDLTVRACLARDVECREPIGEDATADDEGWLDVPVFEGFDGYLELTAPTLVPQMLFYTRLLESNESRGFAVAVIELDELPVLIEAGGDSVEPDTGVIAMRVFNCEGVPAAGVRILHDRGGAPWYFVDRLPSATARATAEVGSGGYLGVQPGISILSTELEDGTPLLPNKQVLVRAGWVTGFWADPSGAAD